MQLQTKHLKTADEDVVVDLLAVAEGGSRQGLPEDHHTRKNGHGH